MLDRQAGFHAVGPFNETYTRSLEVLMRAKVEEVGWRLQPIRVEMINRQAGLIFLNQYKGRTADRA